MRQWHAQDKYPSFTTTSPTENLPILYESQTTKTMAKEDPRTSIITIHASHTFRANAIILVRAFQFCRAR